MFMTGLTVKCCNALVYELTSLSLLILYLYKYIYLYYLQHIYTICISIYTIYLSLYHLYIYKSKLSINLSILYLYLSILSILPGEGWKWTDIERNQLSVDLTSRSKGYSVSGPFLIPWYTIVLGTWIQYSCQCLDKRILI